MTNLYWFIIMSFICVTIGGIIEKYFYERYLVIKAGPEYRTGVFIHKQMYYVLSEKEYLDFIVNQLSKKCNERRM